MTLTQQVLNTNVKYYFPPQHYKALVNLKSTGWQSCKLCNKVLMLLETLFALC